MLFYTLDPCPTAFLALLNTTPSRSLDGHSLTQLFHTNR
jgi:hypothetical protein